MRFLLYRASTDRILAYDYSIRAYVWIEGADYRAMTS